MNELSIILESKELLPGQVLNGRVVWRDMPSHDSLEVHLLWYTEGIGTKDAEVIETINVEHAGAMGERKVSFRLPLSPYSFNGTHISLLWCVEAVGNGGDTVVREGFVLAPDGNVVVLKEVPGSRARNPLNFTGRKP